MITQSDMKGKTESGAKGRAYRGKRLFEIARKATLPKLAEVVKIKKDRMRDSKTKYRILSSNIANVYDSKTKKYAKTKITAVSENKANTHYVRRNILTKGTVVTTELGKAIITNRPGQEGVINAKLL